VGWKKGKDEGGEWMRYDEQPLWKEKDLITYKQVGTLPDKVYQQKSLHSGFLSSCRDL